MKSLAQLVLNTANDLKSKPDKIKRNLINDFKETLSKVPDSALKRKFLANAAQTVVDNEVLAPSIIESMRFTMDKNLADAVEKLCDRLSASQILEMFHYIKPPYPKTWIEYHSTSGVRMGWMIEDENDHLQIGLVVAPNTVNYPLCSGGLKSIVSKDGIKPANDKIADTDKMWTSTQGNIKIAMCILLLLNSRSNIVKINPPSKDSERLNKARSKKGLYPLVSNHEITFDIARILGKDSNLSPEDAKREMAASLVRGHFKVRKTGVFFWSPYVRGAKTAEEKDQVRAEKLGQQRSVTATSSNIGLPRPKF